MAVIIDLFPILRKKVFLQNYNLQKAKDLSYIGWVG